MKCKKHNINMSGSHKAICDSLPPIDEIIAMFGKYRLIEIAEMLETPPQTITKIVKKNVGGKEYRRLLKSSPSRPRTYKKTKGQRCLNCLILLAPEDTGATCNYCRSGVKDERPERGWYTSPQVVNLSWD